MFYITELVNKHSGVVYRNSYVRIKHSLVAKFKGISRKKFKYTVLPLDSYDFYIDNYSHRQFNMFNSSDFDVTVLDTEDVVLTDSDAQENEEHEKIQKELADAKKLQSILIAACGVLGIAFLVTLILFLKQNRESAINK